ncbi:hypothetical protein FOL47_010702 [Perkinsus chesapeaki]|uniref:Uncharacterized protein n=1 Tax=Perkinsus chesapeaki TaxID=330153 RepID=A0A7J6L1U8_PERCH|nr:hypothetical protein FOL47_010702 [Perkinsus chesapeaki]
MDGLALSLSLRIMLRNCLQHLNEVSSAAAAASYGAVQPAPFTIFTEKAMVMLKPTPAVIQKINGELKVKTEGKLSWVFMNKAAPGQGKTYDKQSMLAITLNAAKAAEMLTLSPTTGGTIKPSAFSKTGAQSLTFTPVTVPYEGGDSEQTRQAVRIAATKTAQTITLDATPGELKAMQVLVESVSKWDNMINVIKSKVLPALYGWRLTPMDVDEGGPPPPSVDDFFA